MTNQEKMREAFCNWLETEHGVKPIEGIAIDALANMTNPQLLAGFQAAYQLQQTRIKEMRAFIVEVAHDAYLCEHDLEIKPTQLAYKAKEILKHIPDVGKKVEQVSVNEIGCLIADCRDDRKSVGYMAKEIHELVYGD